MSVWDIVLQQLFNGLVLGSFYSLVALGYSMVYGVIKLLNFAHGDIYMVGSFIGLGVLTFVADYMGAGWPGIVVAMVIAMCLVGILGIIIQRIAYRPLLGAPRLSILISALGVSLVLYNAVMAFTDGEYLAFNTDLGFEGFQIGHVYVTNTKLVLIAVTITLMIGLSLFVSKTLYGKAMRAISIDQDACRLMGIDVYKVIALTFLIGSSLAAAGGVMAGVHYGRIHFFDGFLIGLKAFTAAVIGGIGSIPGAMLGGVVLGMLEAFGTQIPFIGTEWKDVFAFLILIALLVFKPTGFLGRTEIERM